MSVTREGPLGVEIVRRGDGTIILNVVRNGIQHSSHVVDYKEITMVEALAWLVAQIRMGHINP